LAAANGSHVNGATTLKPLLTESLAAISWTLPMDNSNGVIAPRAVALNEAAQPRRATSGSLDQELLASC
jgi:hypothetical protein